ncbi:leucine-rich repeat receptor-like serine/threonine-protein [Vigna angularis]|uniref:Leucine-rich repeat receptor-like serine/threonine-protein n=1 Tax=Phaseolus angularis TaxID=3914 RepID=A0A8T0JH22_PHAAN|nr:leucine-rich repeat receptor-like serine/threonine-protein [Vigna angularis]
MLRKHNPSSHIRFFQLRLHSLMFPPCKSIDSYLSGNLLNGTVPSWIEHAKSMNLFANSITNGSGEDACLEGYTCSQLSYNLHINCGGKEVLVNKSTYDDDGVADGDFLLINLLQEELVKEGFNIAEEAGGNGKAIRKTFRAVVSSNTLKIRLNWAGKGTTALPYKSVYGPLISAITVNSELRGLELRTVLGQALIVVSFVRAPVIVVTLICAPTITLAMHNSVGTMSEPK